MASNTKELLSKLKTSLPRMEEGMQPERTVHVFPEREAEKSPKGNRAPKLSVSLYQRDIDRLDTIKDFMKAQGFRNLSDSEALRLACRKVEIDVTLIEVYKSMQGEDGRRRQE
jgi:hypothetical protein